MKGGYDILPNIMLVGAEQELSQTGKAVSYTHLDVDKRQDGNRHG